MLQRITDIPSDRMDNAVILSSIRKSGDQEKRNPIAKHKKSKEESNLADKVELAFDFFCFGIGEEQVVLDQRVFQVGEVDDCECH